MTRLFASRQFLYFLLTGGLAAVVNFSSRIVLNVWMGFSEAIILAYLIGMITAFCLARRFVFTASTMPLRRSALFFTLVNLAAVLQTWLISMGLSMYVLPAMHVTRLVPEISHAVGVMVPAFTSYIGHKYVSFR
jgi:putative flippase GtrA